MSLQSLATDPQYQAYLGTLEQQYGLPTGILAIQQKQESGFNPDAVSPAGAVGIAQFMPATAKQYGIDPTDPIQSAQGQAQMLSDLGKKYNGDIPSVLAAYNWGSGNLDRKGLANAPEETQKYISNIMGNLGGQQPQQVAPDQGGGALSKFASAIGNAIIPQAQAEEMPPSAFPAQDQTQQQQPQQSQQTPDYSKLSDQELLAEAQKQGIPVSAPQQDYSKLSDDQLIAAAQQQGIPVKSSLGRLAGIGAKGAIQGAASLPAMAGDIAMAIPHGFDALADWAVHGKVPTMADMTPMSSGVQNIASQVGPQASTPDERLLQDATMGVGAMAGGGAAGSLKALLSGAAGGLAGGATREAGGSPALQMLASALGGGVSYAGMGAAENALTRAPSAIMPQELAGQQVASAIKSAPMTSEDIRGLANQAYGAAAEKGGTLTPEFTNNFIDEASKIAPQTEAGKIVAGENPVTQLVARLGALKDKPLSLAEAQEIDETLGDQIDNFVENGKLTKQGKKLYDIQSTFRGMIQNATPDEISGGQEGFDALKQGRQLWAQQAKMRDVEKIISRAQDMDQPATAIRSGFRTLVNNPNRMRGFNAAETAAVRNAAKTGIAVDALRVFGSRLTAIGSTVAGGAVGGPLGAIASGLATHAGSSLARRAATALQMNKANQVLSTISKGVR